MASVIQIVTATSGTVNVTNTGQDVDVIHDGGVTLNLTIALPANPVNGQIVNLSSQGGIGSLNVTAVVGTIINALTGMSAGARGKYLYASQTSKWYKVG